MSKFCENCGSPLKDDERFCSNCGNIVENNSMNTTYIPQNAQMPQSQESSFWEQNKKAIIISIVAILVVLSAVGGGYYYHQKQVLAAQAAAEAEAQAAAKKAADEKAAAEKAAAEQKVQEANAKVRVGISTALDKLQHNEDLLKDMTDKINAGTYDRNYFNYKRYNFFDELSSVGKNVDSYMPNNDEETKNEVKALVEIQIDRANMLYAGLNGDRSKFVVGGQYYDDYQKKLSEFKSKHGM